ncbi:Flp pilus assembly protein CpaB [compost metagenome]
MLAVDQTAGTDKTQPVVVRAVTLEMSAKEAEVLVKAQSEGKLQLALRNPLDAQKQLQAVASVAPAQAAPAMVKPQPRPVAGRSSGFGSVTIIRGTEVEIAKARF